MSRIGKYIVELKKNETLYKATTRESDGTAYVCSAIGTPYTEPDLDAIRNEEYEKGVQDTKQHWVDAPRSCAYRLGYENGLNDAWEAARKIWQSDIYLRVFKVTMRMDCLTKFSASEAIEKIRKYEQEKEGIKVGDEVIAASGKAVIISISADKDQARYIYPDSTLGVDSICNLSTTGRHFPGIATVLQKMREEKETQ